MNLYYQSYYGDYYWFYLDREHTAVSDAYQIL